MNETDESAICLTDADARMMGNRNQGFDIAYNMQTVVDGKHHIIVECDVINNPTDRGELTPMAQSLKNNGYINEDTAYLADKGYHSGEDLAKMDALGIKAVVPRQNPSHVKNQPEMFWPTGFIYNAVANTYTCPAGHILHPCKVRSADTKRHSYINKEACNTCPHKEACIGRTKAGFRTIKRNEFADAMDAAEQTYKENKQLYNLRRELVEHPFGTIKRYMNGGYFLLRTLEKVRGEGALLCLAYNIKRASNALGFNAIMAMLDARLSFVSSFLRISLNSFSSTSMLFVIQSV